MAVAGQIPFPSIGREDFTVLSFERGPQTKEEVHRERPQLGRLPAFSAGQL